MKSWKIIASIILSIGLLVFVISSIKGIDGTYLYAKIIYPYTMILLILFKKIGAIPWILTFFQIPVYTLLIASKPKAKYYIVAVHIILAIICVYLPTDLYQW